MLSLIRIALGLAAFGLLCAFYPADGRAATVTLHPTQDTAIYSALPTLNFGGGTTITAGGRPKAAKAEACYCSTFEAVCLPVP